MLKGVSHTNWEFAGFKVMTEARLLLSQGTPVPLTSKAFDTLVLLISNRDRVVTKDELLHSIWPDVAVEEGNLTQQIFLLRKALGETAQQPRYVVTVPGHGYRFTGRVKEISHDAAATGVAPPRSRFIAAGLVVFGLIAVLALVLSSGWRAGDENSPPLDLARARITKVTESGKAANSAISPDGRYVAYIENDGDEHSLWVRQIATGGKTQIVARGPQVLRNLSFSQDGEYIYFTRSSAWLRGGAALSRIPAIGGLETPILDDVDTPVSFSPDGRQFVFMRGAGRETHIVIAEAGGGSPQILATRSTPLAFSFVAPDWSPDGKVVAASGSDQSKGLQSSIVLLPVDGGGSRELHTTDSRIGRIRWLRDGSGLLTVVSETLARQFAPWQTNASGLLGGPIWHIAYPGGRAERLTSDLADYDLCCLDITANGSAVSSVINTLVSDLWIASADHLDAPRQITWGHPVLARHSWLPDNDTIVYRDLSGRVNAVHKDGREFNLSLPDGLKAVGGVSVCGDGRYVTFQAVPGNKIWRVPPNAGGAAKLTSGFLDSNPGCSGDGKWVVYNSLTAGRPSLWRVPIEGGEPTPLVPGESFDALPSPSGRLIYYAAFEWEERPVRTRVSRWIVMSATDGKRLFGLDVPTSATFGVRPEWAPDESGLDYVVTRNSVSNIWRQPLTGAPPVQITQFSTGKIFSFTWSPDGRWLSLGSGVNRSDVVVISRAP